MKIPGIFKKKPEKRKAPARKKVEQPSVADVQPEKKIQAPRKLSQNETSFKVLVAPHITEKAAIAAEHNQYIFKVVPGVNKEQIKNAVRELYQVKVEKVRVITVPSKKIRVGMREGVQQGYRKAIVTIAEGQKIEVISQ